MAKKDKRIDTYIENAPDFAKPILYHLRELVLKACPGVKETIKERFPTLYIRMKSYARWHHLKKVLLYSGSGRH